MDLRSGFTHLFKDYKPTGDDYEWWYTDGLSEDGKNGFVIIFYRNNPFSTRYIREIHNNSIRLAYPALSVSIYNQGKTEYYSFLEFSPDDATFDSGKKIISIGESFISWNLKSGKMEISLKQNLDSGHNIRAEITCELNAISDNLIEENDPGGKHFWNLLQPGMKFHFKGDIKGAKGRQTPDFKGTAYHDHNVGMEPMKDSFEDWYWGRFHFYNYSFLYYVMNGAEKQQYRGWIIDKEGKKILSTSEKVDFKKTIRSVFGLKSSREIEFKGDDHSISVINHKAIDNGPFYQRFLSNAVIRYNGKVEAAHGISEYIRPERIYNRKFWPLVHMRLRYMDQEPHWVQKSSFWYPFTW